MRTSMPMNLALSLHDNIIKDPCGIPVRAAFVEAQRIVLLQTAEQKSRPKTEPWTLDVEMTGIGTPKNKEPSPERNILVIAGRIYNVRDVENGSRLQIAKVRALELDEGEILTITGLWPKQHEIEIQGRLVF